MLKKSMVKLASLGLLLLAFAAPGQAQAKAKTTTPKTTNAVLWLNYNTYVYNKKGQRIRWFKGTKGWQKYYKKGTKIKTKRTVKRTTKDVRYYLLYSYDTSDDTSTGCRIRRSRATTSTPLATATTSRHGTFIVLTLLSNTLMEKK